MVRCRFVDSVLIQVSGPKSLLPEGPKMETGRLSMTWIHFLNAICGLQLEPTRDDYFICTSTYTTTSEGGWTANLNDTIKPFIDKFSRRRSLYCVRLHTGQIPESDASDDTASATAIPDTDTNDTAQPWMSTSLEHPIPKMKTTPVKKFASTVPLKPSQCHLQWASSSFLSQTDEPSASTSTAKVVELPTPVLRIPIRGCPAGASSSPQQSVTAAQLFQKPDGKGISSSKSRMNPPPPSGSTIKKKNKYIPEFTLRIGIGRLSKNSIVSVSEPSPPKLSRFDEMGRSPTEPQPGPSNASTKVAPSSPSPRINASPSSSSLKRRFDEKDGVNSANGSSKNRSDSSTLVGIKREIIEIDLEDMEQSDEEEEQHQQGNGYDPQAFLQNERSIMGILGILGGDGEEDNEDLVGRIEKKLDNFDTSTLEKVKEEMRKLKLNKTWERNVRRSPMACYFLQEIFKD